MTSNDSRFVRRIDIAFRVVLVALLALWIAFPPGQSSAPAHVSSNARDQMAKR